MTLNEFNTPHLGAVLVPALLATLRNYQVQFTEAETRSSVTMLELFIKRLTKLFTPRSSSAICGHCDKPRSIRCARQERRRSRRR